MIPQQGLFGRWYPRHPIKPGLAWTGYRWAAHTNGMGITYLTPLKEGNDGQVRGGFFV